MQGAFHHHHHHHRRRRRDTSGCCVRPRGRSFHFERSFATPSTSFHEVTPSLLTHIPPQVDIKKLLLWQVKVDFCSALSDGASFCYCASRDSPRKSGFLEAVSAKTERFLRGL